MRRTSDPVHDSPPREAMRRALSAMLRRTQDGHRLMAVVYGDAGHGKTTLLDGFAADATDMGSVVVRLVGGALDREIPYAGVHSLLTRNFDLLGSADTPAERLLWRMVTDFSPPSSALTMCSAVSDWLDCVSSAPVVICVDDADRLDEDSLRVLAYAASRQRSGYVTVVCTATDQVPLLQRVHAGEFTLDDLDADASRALVAQAGLPATLTSTVLHRLGGNPLALGHASRVLVETMSPTSTQTLDEMPIALRLRAYTDERLHALAASSQHLLEAVAVSGETDLQVLGTWVETAALGPLDSLLRDVESSGLVEADELSVRWRRPWMAESVNSQCSAPRRRRLQAQLPRPDPNRSRHRTVRAPHHDVSLTDAERRVATVVAFGGSNREAATRLHVSEKKIETHLQHIYRKIGVRSRTQLAARLLPLLIDADGPGTKSWDADEIVDRR
jgi:DNA-binding NarL/FixJ family response regulator